MDISKEAIFAPLYEKTPPEVSPLVGLTPDLGNFAGGEIPLFTNFQLARPVDLVLWQRYYRANARAALAPGGTPSGDVLTALGRLQPQLDDFVNAVTKPGAYWPVDYEAPFAFPFEGITRTLAVTKVFSLRAAARLGAHDPAGAARDFVMAVHLNDPLMRTGSLLAYLVGLADFSLDESTVWEGIHQHQWTVDQLQDFERTWAAVDLPAGAVRAMRIERAELVCLLRSERLIDVARDGKPSSHTMGLAHFYALKPGGRWETEASGYARRVQQKIEGINVAAGLFGAEGTSDDVQADPNAILGAATDALGGFLQHSAEAETYRREERLACRLEEFWLEQGHYPATLDELPGLPPHLNQRVTSEAPLIYVLKGNSYLIYSPGWDGVDRGGTPRKAGQSGANYDWAWPGP